MLKRNEKIYSELAEKSNFKNYPIIEINKRSLDGQYNVWAYVKQSDRLDVEGIGVPEKNESIINNALGGCWILIAVHKNKRIATETMKKKYGSNCFKTEVCTNAHISYRSTPEYLEGV
tara:strand:- start:514 stop:867 length:354 start_codon:yes stop_codon:yes gene_type:complete